MPLSDAIIMSIIVSLSGLLALCCKLLYSSKCKTVKLCCINITRDVERENNLTNITMQTPNQV